jgi:hypothetical protein
MQGLIAQVGGSSAGAVVSIFASRQWDFAFYSDSESMFAPVGNYLEPMIGIYGGERDQWDLPDETASANASLPILVTPLGYSAILQPCQILLRHNFEWWSHPLLFIEDFGWRSPLLLTSVFDRVLDHVSVGVSQEGCLSDLWYKNLVSHFAGHSLQHADLGNLYDIEDSEAVTAFLTQNAFLRDLLVEAHGKIVEFFGEGTNVHLELVDDPDLGEDRQLYAVIFTSLATKDAIPLQESLDNAWWLDNLERASGKFNIIVEYV